MPGNTKSTPPQNCTRRRPDLPGLLVLLLVLLLPPAASLADPCDEAGEWYDEGLLLSDNSAREVSYYRRAITLCPEFIAAYNRLGEVYRNQGKYALSKEAFERARIQALSSSRFSSRSGSMKLFLESVISLGEIYRLQGKYEKAAAEYTKALEIDPDSRAAQNSLQYVYKRMHAYDDMRSPNSGLLPYASFTRISGMTRPRGTWALDFQYKQWDQVNNRTLAMLDGEEITIITPLRSSALFFKDLKGLIAPSNTDATIKTGILSARIGLTNTFTIGLVPKYFYRDIDSNPEGVTSLELPSLKGMGDTELLLKYRLWGRRDKHLSVYTLVNIPTGEEKELISKNPIATTYNVLEDGSVEVLKWDYLRYVPFGSESWDVTPGFAFTWDINPLILQSNVQYRITDGYLIGDEFRANLAGIYRFTEGVTGTMELNYRWQGDTRRNLHVVLFKRQPSFIGPDLLPAGPVAVETEYTVNGGDSLYLSPGLQFNLTRGLTLEFAAQIPVTSQDADWHEEIIYLVGLSFMSF